MKTLAIEILAVAVALAMLYLVGANPSPRFLLSSYPEPLQVWKLAVLFISALGLIAALIFANFRANKSAANLSSSRR